MERFKTILEKKYNGVDYIKDNNTYSLNNWEEFKIEKLFEKSSKIEVEIEGEMVFNEKKGKNQFKPKKIIFKDHEYSRTHNQPVAVNKHEPEQPRGRQNEHRKEYPSNQKSPQWGRMPATSPYNFAPINAYIVESNAPANDFSAFTGNCGYLDFEIENMNLVFIRGLDSSFFKINNKFCMPGSSLRGLVRTMVELFSFSKMNFFEKNKRLFMRFIAASRSDFKSNYYHKMGLSEDRNTNVEHLAQAGLLKYDRVSKSYFIYPSRYRTFIQETYQAFNIVPVENGYKVFSGKINGKHKHYIIDKPDSLPKGIKVEQKTIREYDTDSTRKIEIDLLKGAKNSRIYPMGIPVFYAQVGDKITSIGHTKNYRIPYDKKIGDFVNEAHHSSIIDFAESIFGIVDEKNAGRTRAGKVFVEDFYAKNQPVEHQEKTPKVLGSPRPTSFQLYLEQPRGIQTTVEELHHWDTDNALIRGNKLYWHRFLGNAPTAPDDYSTWAVDTSHSQFKPNASPKPIRALEKGTKFSGRIRFENLTDEELGALIFALNLPKDCCHKIGMAKPLGLGSIQIKDVKLHLKNTETRYQSLFNEHNSFETGIVEESTENIQSFADKFTNYILSKLKLVNVRTPENFWEIPRMKELKKMLTFDEKSQSSATWVEKTKYQTLSDFRQRSVLPKPTEL